MYSTRVGFDVSSVGMSGVAVVCGRLKAATDFPGSLGYIDSVDKPAGFSVGIWSSVDYELVVKCTDEIPTSQNCFGFAVAEKQFLQVVNAGTTPEWKARTLDEAVEAFASVKRHGHGAGTWPVMYWPLCADSWDFHFAVQGTFQCVCGGGLGKKRLWMEKRGTGPLIFWEKESDMVASVAEVTEVVTQVPGRGVWPVRWLPKSVASSGIQWHARRYGGWAKVSVNRDTILAATDASADHEGTRISLPGGGDALSAYFTDAGTIIKRK